MKYILLFSFLFVFSFSQAQITPLIKVKIEVYGGDGNCNGFIRLTGCSNYAFTTYCSNWQTATTNNTYISPACAGSYTISVADGNLNYTYISLMIWSNGSSYAWSSDTIMELFSTNATYFPATSIPPNCNDSISLSIHGGYPPYSISWLDSLLYPLVNETDSLLQNICSPNYIFYISDADFCTNSVGNNYVKLSETKPVIEIYPNPSAGNFTIKSSKSISKIEIKSISGQTVCEESDLLFEEKTLSLNLEKGIYFVVSTNTNGSCSFEKLVVN